MHVHMVVPDLILPREAAAEGYSGLRLPALEKMLARGELSALPAPLLEDWLCAAFGVENGAIAPVTLLAEGENPGAAYWLRADPVHLMLRGSEIVLHPVASLNEDEAMRMCDSLNRHFAEEGLHFIAPGPQRWYLRLERAPELITHSVARVAGRDIGAFLPHGADVLEWHRLLNEIQMLLTSHPVNSAREARGDWVVNSIWPWGGGRAPGQLLRPCARIYTDSPLAGAFATAAGMEPLSLPAARAGWAAGDAGTTLIVWDGLRHALQHGDLGEWRDSLVRLEQHCTQPLLRDLRRGRIQSVTLDVLLDYGLRAGQGSRRCIIERGGAWQFWRLSRRMEHYAG